ncbi:ABC transporter ATP-binding protein [bacterium]|nr:ABC transporter ATP-binding protein [bacterium]
MKIETFKLSKWYGQVIGVNNLTCSIEPGVTGLLGPNGAGKTTLIKLLTGQLRPSQGSVRINGEEVWNNHNLFKYIGYAPENDAFWRFMTGEQFVYSLTRMYGFNHKDAQSLTLKALDAVDMNEGKSKKIAGYSKGMRQRIKIAQALSSDPDILIFDEPLNGMDPIGRRKTIEIIRRIGQMGKIVIVSSHILHEIEEMTDTIILLSHGRVLAQGNIYEIRELIDTHPLNVVIKCSNVDILTSKLMEFKDVRSVQFDREQNQLMVETLKPDEFHKRIPQIALANDITIYSLYSPDENLEAVFSYLVR